MLRLRRLGRTAQRWLFMEIPPSDPIAPVLEGRGLAI